MASTNGPQTDPLNDPLLGGLHEKPFDYDFFYAVRQLENRFPDLPKVGTSFSPREDAIRFGQRPSLAFATSTLNGLEVTRSGLPKLNVNFFGLLGPNGPLPINYTDYTRERQRNLRDGTLSAFFDIFHHRLLSLFYRAWAVNQKAVDFDRPGESRFSTYIGSVFGLAEESHRSRDSIPDDAKRYYAGLLGSESRGAVSLEAILSDFFEAPVEVEQMVGHWLPITERYHCLLGSSPERCLLGETAVVGSRVWDVQNRIRIRLGPVGFERFQSFLPTERSFERLRDWLGLYSTFQFHWDLQLVLKSEEVPMTQLGAGAQIGWTSWVRSEPVTADAADLVIDQSETRTEIEHHER